MKLPSVFSINLHFSLKGLEDRRFNLEGLAALFLGKRGWLKHRGQRRRLDLVPQIVESERLQVFLRGGDVLVAEERLQRLDVDAGLEYLRGEGVSPLVQVELLAKRPVAAISLFRLTAVAIQFRPVGNLFAQLEQVRIGLVAAIVFPFRMWRSREDQY